MSYFLYYCEYGKLARYFLANLFRFPSSYGLMIITYGIRPFLKGAIHGLLYENWEAQIWSLMGIEIALIITTFGFEFFLDNHRSKLLFMMEITYYECLVVLNVLLLCKYDYFSEST